MAVGGEPPKPKAAFEVFPYSIDEFEAIITRALRNSAEFVSEKLHRQYFQGYFSYIGARTIVVEHDYIDRDYLEDYAAYYVRCFAPYDKKCVRLHFFGSEFTTEALTTCLSSPKPALTSEQLQNHYLGFIVIKPLPQTFIGRTCLAIYDRSGSGGRYFPATYEYEANLYGIPLKIKRTLPFQEQDSVVAACATSALWSVFQGTGKIFHHNIPSPAMITAAATEHLPAETRTMPNHGLSSHMMAQAIRRVGLEPYLVEAADHYVLKSTLYAYLRSRMPLVLGVNLFDNSIDPTGPSEFIGKHAIAIAGYSLGLPPQPREDSGFLLRAARMDKIYVHDDQVGPFARMELMGKSWKVRVNGDIKELPALSTSWKGHNKSNDSVVAVSDILLMPLYHKIRIPYEVVLDSVIHFDSLLAQIGEQGPPLDQQRIEWDIHLSTVNAFKTRLLRERRVAGDKLFEILSSQMPRFIWRATGFIGENPLIDLIFDATDIEQGEFIVQVIEYDQFIGAYLAELFADPAFDDILNKHRGRKILKWFKDRPPKRNQA